MLASISYQVQELAQAIFYYNSFLLLHYKLMQIQWLKATHLYYLTFSVNQESGHGWQAPLFRLQSRCWPVGVLLDAWLEKNLLSSLFRLLTELICFCLYDRGPWLPTGCLAGGQTQFPACSLTHGRVHGPFTPWQFSSKPPGECLSVSLCLSLSSYVTKHHMRVTSYHLCHILLVKFILQILPALERIV